MSSAGTTSSSPVSAIAFRWLDILEKEFDKSYVGLDHQLAQVLNIREEDGEDRVGKDMFWLSDSLFIENYKFFRTA